NQTENQEKESDKISEIAKNILTPKHSPKHEEPVEIEDEPKIDLKTIACPLKESNVISKEEPVNPFIQNQDKPIDLRLSDAQLKDLLQEHGDKLKCLNLGIRQ